MSGIDKGFLFGILTEVLRGNKRPTFRLSDCKGRALRKVQEKDSARVKGEAP